MVRRAVTWPSDGPPTPNCPGRRTGGWAHFTVRLVGELPLLVAGSSMCPWPCPLLHLLQRQTLEIHRIKDLAEHLSHVVHSGLEEWDNLHVCTKWGRVFPPLPHLPGGQHHPPLGALLQQLLQAVPQSWREGQGYRRSHKTHKDGLW